MLGSYVLLLLCCLGFCHVSISGGYNELFSNSIGYAFTPNAAALKDYTMARTVNSMMHQVEALEALHRVTNDQTVLQRMLETLDIMCSKLVRLRGHLLDVYEPQSTTGGQWQPAAGAIVSYGECVCAHRPSAKQARLHDRMACCYTCPDWCGLIRLCVCVPQPDCTPWAVELST